MAIPRMADVRVYLLTYRRNDLLPRALESLLRQTHTNWVCELHNDDPEDLFPEQLVAKVNDPRISYVRHEKNLGPIGTFNLAFQPVAETYVSILEDDNWWESEFLATMLNVMRQQPQVNLAWANMWLFLENSDGTWQRNGSIWPETGLNEIELFSIPVPRQVCGFLHSQGAMLLRVSPATTFNVPITLPLFAIEPARERCIPGPLLLVPRPLANFAVTLKTARRGTADQNMQILALLAQTFLAYANVGHDFLRQTWLVCRGSHGHTHRSLLVGAMKAGCLWQVLCAASLADLALVLAWALRHPLRFLSLFRAGKDFPDVLAFLERASRGRSTEWNLNLKKPQVG